MKNGILKKIAAGAVALALTLSLTACMGTTSSNSSSTAELTVSEETKDPDMANYTDDYEGLVQYLKDSEVLAGDGTDMSADYIGAKQGQKFSFTYSGTSITCELYYFDPDDLNDTAKANIAQLNESGTFKSLNGDVEAKISASGKFMMIYTNKSDEDAQVSMTTRITDKFTNFVGGKK